MTETTPSPEEMPSTDRRVLSALVLAGLVLLLTCLYWNRIALGGRLGRAPEWVHDLARPFSVVYEGAFGPIATDPIGTPQNHRIAQLLGSWVVATVAYFVAVWLALRRPDKVVGPALDVVLATAIVCRVVLVFSPPILETDPCRYLWDGATLASGLNPYHRAPLEVFQWSRQTARMAVRYHPDHDARGNAELSLLAALSEDPALTRHFLYINHPAAPTVYPPVAQHLFSIVHRIDPGNVYVLKAFVALLDLGIVWLIASLLALLGRPPGWVVLYGWCPVVLKEYAQTGHYDPTATFCLLAALTLLVRGRRTLSGAYLGLAALGKLYPLVIVPVLFRKFGVGAIVACAVTIALFWAPFLGIGTKAFAGLAMYSRDWVMNSSIFSLLKDGPLSFLDRNPAVLGGGPDAARAAEDLERNRNVRLDGAFVAKALVGLTLLVFLVRLARRPERDAADTIGKAFAAVAALFLLSPVCNPWYCAWLMPFAALYGRVSWVVLSSTMVAYYAFRGLGTWRVAPWEVLGPAIDLRVVEYLPFYALLLVEEWQAGPGPSSDGGSPPGRTDVDPGSPDGIMGEGLHPPENPGRFDMARIDQAYRYITTIDGVRSGRPVVEGTRIGVHDVIGLILNGADVNEVISSFPSLTRAQVYECMAYHEDHRGEIDFAVARQMADSES